MDWHRHPATRWRLRFLGVILLIAASAAGRRLLADALGHDGHPPAIAYLLALICFLGFSAGGALLVHGYHLFDTIHLSERWRRLPVDPPPARTASPAPRIADPVH